MNLNCMIVPVSELGEVDFSLVTQTSAATCRRSVDRTKAIISWQGGAPAFVWEINGSEGPMSFSDLKVKLLEPAWAHPAPR